MYNHHWIIINFEINTPKLIINFIQIQEFSLWTKHTISIGGNTDARSASNNSQQRKAWQFIFASTVEKGPTSGIAFSYSIALPFFNQLPIVRHARKCLCSFHRIRNIIEFTQGRNLTNAKKEVALNPLLK